MQFVCSSTHYFNAIPMGEIPITLYADDIILMAGKK